MNNTYHSDHLLSDNKDSNPIVKLINYWILYADDYDREYGKLIENDAVLGDDWIQIGVALRSLLVSEVRRLDVAALDSLLLRTLEQHGVDTDTI